MNKAATDPLYPLIEKSYSLQEAQRHAAFNLDDQQRRGVMDLVKSMLNAIPPLPGACAFMGAMWAAAIRDNLGLPAYCVAGELHVEGGILFGRAPVSAAHFSSCNLDWDGHCWVAIGDHIGDPSLFRTAYSAAAPPLLSEFVLRKFGPGRGTFLGTAEGLRPSGLIYVPRYVVTDAQLTGLVKGAHKVFTGQ